MHFSTVEYHQLTLSPKSLLQVNLAWVLVRIGKCRGCNGQAVCQNPVMIYSESCSFVDSAAVSFGDDSIAAGVPSAALWLLSAQPLLGMPYKTPIPSEA